MGLPLHFPERQAPGDGPRSRSPQADQAKAQQKRQQLTLARAARDDHERVIEPRLSAKHAAQWLASLENHVPAELWHKPIGEVEAPELLAALPAVKPHERARNVDGDRVPETLRCICMACGQRSKCCTCA